MEKSSVKITEHITKNGITIENIRKSLVDIRKEYNEKHKKED